MELGVGVGRGGGCRARAKVRAMITVTARARARSAMRTITPSASVGASTATHDLTADHSCCGRRGPATVPGSGSAPAGGTSSIQPRDLTCMHMHMHMHTQAAQVITRMIE